MCLHSCPLAGRTIRRKVIGHLRDIFTAVCSTLSSPLPLRWLFVFPATFEKFLLIFVIQCSAGNKRFRKRPCKTDRTLGRWTSCNTNKCDWKEIKRKIKFTTFTYKLICCHMHNKKGLLSSLHLNLINLYIFFIYNF